MGSTADLLPEYQAQVSVVPLTVHFGDQEYVDGVTIDHKEFYNKLVESDAIPTTSQPTPDAYAQAFREAQAAGEQMVVLAVASNLSGTCQSAMIAAADFPGMVWVVGTKTAAIAGGILSIKPVLTIRDGEIVILGKARGSKQGNNLFVAEIERAGGVDFGKPVMLGYFPQIQKENPREFPPGGSFALIKESDCQPVAYSRPQTRKPPQARTPVNSRMTTR